MNQGVGLFQKLRSLRAFERQHLPFLQTVEDVDLVLEIGYHQEIGQPLSMKQIYLMNLASVATIQRRLRRLKDLGAIVTVKCKDDARSVQLRVGPKLYKAYAKYGELIGIHRSEREAA